MDEQEILTGIVNAIPYPIVFVDNEYVIRYMNRAARYHYIEERGYPDLIGRCLLDFHTPASAARIKAAYAAIRQNGKEVYIGVTVRNQRVYMQGVRGKAGEWIGFYERFELNLEK